MPKDFPPIRGRYHFIVLKEECPLVNCDPIVSLFSSLVLLVKDNIGVWRFCVDNRALYKNTVLDKFRIPVLKNYLMNLIGQRYSLN